MNNKFTYLLSLLALLFVSVGASAQPGAVAGDFRSNATGNWSATSTWQQFDGTTWNAVAGAPNGSGIGKIFIMSPNVVTLDESVEIGVVEVMSGAELDFAGNGTGWTVTEDHSAATGDDMTVDVGGILKLGFFNTWTKGTGSPTAMINGTFNWTSGTLALPTTVASGATANLFNGGSPSDKDLNANFTNNGTMTWTAGSGLNTGDIFMSGGVIFTNNPSGVINENFSSAHAFSGTTANRMNNQGIINKTTSNNLNFGTSFNGNGGTIRGNGASSGNFGAIDFATLGGSVFVNTGTYSPGNGTISGTLTLDPILFNNGSTQAPSLNITITSTGNVAGTNYDQAIIGGTGQVDISGTTLNVTNGPSAFDAAGTVYTVLSAPNGIANSGTTSFAATNLSPGLGNLTINANSVTVQKIVALPLTWGSFDASAQANGTVSLKWTTLQEANTAHFVIERNDGSGFNPVGTVAAAGNSAQTSQYSFVDAHPTLNGTNLYRLQEVDLDGKINYSSVRAVSFKEGQLVKVLANPNPAHDLLNLNVQGDGLRALFVDGLGHTLHAWILQNGYQQVNIQDVPAGEYQLLIYQNNQKIDVQHIVKF
jgi:hypothetical protein